jgi:hypothetical protein
VIKCQRPEKLQPTRGEKKDSVTPRDLDDKHIEDQALAKICADRVDKWIEWYQGLPK